MPGTLAMNPMVYWILRILLGISTSVAIELWACVLEGKRVPTFPGFLCRQRQRKFIGRAFSGLQFTSTLGEALALLTKHGLDTERRKEFPVEVVMESLLSTSPLMVAAAPDMDLMSCIEHFLEHCVDGEGQIASKFARMSVGNLLRGGCKQHVLTTADIPTLRSKANKCLQVRYASECECLHDGISEAYSSSHNPTSHTLHTSHSHNTLAVVGARPGPRSH